MESIEILSQMKLDLLSVSFDLITYLGVVTSVLETVDSNLGIKNMKMKQINNVMITSKKISFLFFFFLNTTKEKSRGMQKEKIGKFI